MCETGREREREYAVIVCISVSVYYTEKTKLRKRIDMKRKCFSPAVVEMTCYKFPDFSLKQK